MIRARRRVDRADMLACLGSILGLMGTLIPLGPGLAALGKGDVSTLAQAVTVAFDTTAVGLPLGRLDSWRRALRRSFYDRLLDRLEGGDSNPCLTGGAVDLTGGNLITTRWRRWPVWSTGCWCLRGLMAALMVAKGAKSDGQGRDVKRSKDSNYHSLVLAKWEVVIAPVGRVFRDPQTGKLIPVEPPGAGKDTGN